MSDNTIRSLSLPAAGQSVEQQLEHIRSQLIDRLLLAAAAMSIAYLPMLLWQAADNGWYPLLRVYGGFCVYFLLAAGLRRRLPGALKSFLLVAALAVVGLAGVYYLGMVGTGYWWCLQASMIAVMLYSLRVALGVAAGCAAAMAAIGFGFASGQLGTPPVLDGYAKSASAWGSFLSVVVFTPLLLMYAFGVYQQTIARLLEEINSQRRELARRVGHDLLTGLPQAGVAADRLAVALRRAHRKKAKVALLFADLDGFKAINDAHGHAAGDHLLKALAQRMTASVRRPDLVARVGGDEFVILLSDVASDAAACRLAQALIEAATAAVPWQDRTLQISASIGVALFPDHGDDAASLRAAADAAMYRAKRLGKNRWELAQAVHRTSTEASGAAG